MAWNKEYPSLKDGGWFWLRDKPTDAPRLTQLNGGYNFYEPLGVVCETTEYLGPVTPADSERLATLRQAAQAALEAFRYMRDVDPGHWHYYVTPEVCTAWDKLRASLSPQSQDKDNT